VRAFLKAILVPAILFVGASASGADPTLEADALGYDMATQTQTATGNAVMVHEGVTVEADTILFDRAHHIARAKGNVRVTKPGFRLVTQDLSYGIDDRSFTCGAFRAGFPPLFLEGESAYGNPEQIELSHVTAYYGEPEKSTPSMHSDKMVLSTGQRLLAAGNHPGIGGYRLFRIPELSGTLKKLPSVNATLDAGYTDSLGAFVSADVLVPLSSRFATGANLDFYSRRGVLIGPSVGYDTETAAGEASGSVSGGWISDSGNRGYDYFAEAVPANRWFVRQRHIQNWDDSFYLTSYINLMSDPEMLRDFRPEFFDNEQYPDSYVEAALPMGDNVVASLLTRFSIGGGDYATIERLPELRFDLLTTPLSFGGLYHTGFASVAATRYSVNDNRSSSGRMSAYYGLRRPFALAPWLSFVPRAGGFTAYYDDSVDASGASAGSATHYIGELGADLTATFHADWAFKSQRWGVNGLRHIVRPVVYWRRYGTAGDDMRYDPLPDGWNPPVVMPSIDLRDLEGGDSRYLYNPHFVRTGVENVLQTRDGDVSRELASLNLYNDSNFGDHSLDTAFIQTRLYPTKFIAISFENGFDLSPLVSRWYRARLTLKSAELWRLNFYCDFDENNYETYSASYFYQLTRNWGTMVGGSYDARQDEFNRLTFGLYQNVGSFWKIRYHVGYNKNDLRHNDFGASISIAGGRF